MVNWVMNKMKKICFLILFLPTIISSGCVAYRDINEIVPSANNGWTKWASTSCVFKCKHIEITVHEVPILYTRTDGCLFIPITPIIPLGRIRRTHERVTVTIDIDFHTNPSVLINLSSIFILLDQENADGVTELIYPTTYEKRQLGFKTSFDYFFDLETKNLKNFTLFFNGFDKLCKMPPIKFKGIKSKKRETYFPGVI